MNWFGSYLFRSDDDLFVEGVTSLLDVIREGHQTEETGNGAKEGKAGDSQQRGSVEVNLYQSEFRNLHLKR